MDRPNPLMRRRLDPISGGDTRQDFEERIRASRNPSSLMIGQAFQRAAQMFSRLADRYSHTATPLHLDLDAEDRLPMDSIEGKEDLERMIASDFSGGPQLTSTYVENLKTGKFQYFKSNDLVMEEKKPVYEPLSQEEQEIEVYLKLEAWSFRLYRFFFVLQGFLAGMALLHIYIIFHDSDEELTTLYGPLSRTISSLFIILTFFALVGMLHRVISERKHYKKISETRVDIDVEKDRTPYIIGWFCVICYGIAYAISIANIPFMNEMHFKDNQNHSWPETEGLGSSFSDSLQAWVIICCIREILIIIAWIIFCIQKYWNVGSIYRLRLEEIKNKETVTVLTYLQSIYKHLFFGNPYLPFGVYETNNKKGE